MYIVFINCSIKTILTGRFLFRTNAFVLLSKLFNSHRHKRNHT
nr:MAG TPA: hypothetical protein [Caudoviricetes sp.]